MTSDGQRINCRRARIEADEIRGPFKHRQTNMHHAQRIEADGHVRIVIITQYPNRDENPERPAEGSVIEGEYADATGREVDVKKGDLKKGDLARLRHNVLIILRNRSIRRPSYGLRSRRMRLLRRSEL